MKTPRTNAVWKDAGKIPPRSALARAKRLSKELESSVAMLTEGVMLQKGLLEDRDKCIAFQIEQISKLKDDLGNPDNKRFFIPTEEPDFSTIYAPKKKDLLVKIKSVRASGWDTFGPIKKTAYGDFYQEIKKTK